ncbi:helix-turn-helix domain-containing protein [Ethanoligenens harbinense]|uniref:Helix-turn-helix domain protein n=1 Tax=Ethanoligenens harbinense (strain DSM 18485 / JCM 12961 / CGMCC 1.5033 / YUAN-3) TaxID=663278 RepID=E6U8Y5_ETHHY|nr:helix-turn-helix transcriptional regulator [Ethanoligenens harbinense]ADU26049.1 helix-turn-helix domain protein [Ethanoligenens harbinense YUAN-3]AVQ95193.1 XRE family transcriptional regulator [Ethanoligenens harbinense YUAN-3]AYF37883.1 XRE family transcriptional regulator [Ethanoligenens harbinense]AYF40607.1 XRE family transcriptional regulator [Ethanoligenens harbinense]QCN91440.1 XRE family transcriptional regulator [Ethanoligenens harbinense]
MADERKNENRIFAKHLRELLDNAGHTQQDVADYVGVTRQAVAQWKDGKTIPDINNFRALARFFEVPYEYLIGDTESRVREHFDLADTLGLSDAAIHALQSYRREQLDEDSQPTCITQSEIISRILADKNFWRFLGDLQGSIQKHKQAHDREMRETADQSMPTGASQELVREARQTGYEILSNKELSDFYAYRAETTIRNIVMDMPEQWLMETLGIRKPAFYEGEPESPDDLLEDDLEEGDTDHGKYHETEK